MRTTALSFSLIAAALLAVPAIGADEPPADAARMAMPAVGAVGQPGVGMFPGGAGPGTLVAGVQSNATTTQVFRFSNAGRAAGTVTATLYDAATGTSLGTWTSASVAVGAAIEVTAAQIASGTTPALSAAQQAAALNIAVSAAFRGSVQQLSRTAGVIVNQSDCGGGGYALGYVEGPGFSGVTGAVRIINAGATAGTVTLSLRDAATGTELGKYTSASVPTHGAVTVTTAAMAAAATPIVASSTTALAIVPTAATARLQTEHLATVTGSTTVTNLSASCGI